MNDTMNETSETSTTPEAEEEKPLTNGHHSSDGEEVEEEEVVVSQAPVIQPHVDFSGKFKIVYNVSCVVTKNENENGAEQESSAPEENNKAEALDDLVAVMDCGKSPSPVPQITINSPDESEHSIQEEEIVAVSKTEQEVEQSILRIKESKEEGEQPEEETKTEDEEEEEEESESESEEEEEDNSVEFVKGIRCSDAWTALEILNTKYRLSNAVPPPPKKKKTQAFKKTQVYHTLPRAKVSRKKQQHDLAENKTEIQDINAPKKCIITWSCWNISDMVHPVSGRTSVWAKEPEPEPEHDENANIKDMRASIGIKADEIDALVAKVLEEERKKKEQEERLKEAEKPKEEPKPVEEDKLEPVEEAPIQAVAAPTEEAEKPKKKKKGNLWQRMVRSVRKRFGNNRTRA